MKPGKGNPRVCIVCNGRGRIPRIKLRRPEEAMLHQRCRRPKVQRKRGRL